MSTSAHNTTSAQPTQAGVRKLTAKECKRVAKENEERETELRAYYNPVTGEGAGGGRRALCLKEDETWHLPIQMFAAPLVQHAQEAGSLAAMAEEIGVSYDQALAALKELRYDHDFEFWCATCIRIETKKEGHQPFILNAPQRRLAAEFERQRLAGRPIRVVLLKARQWGGSTCTQIYMMWMQQRHKRTWHSFVCAQDKSAAKRIRGMYSLAAASYPADVGTITLKPYEGSQSIRQCIERESILGVASVERPEAVRSYTYQMLHLSEVGLWKSRPTVNAESFAQALSGALVDAPSTFCVIESTAKGVGNFFHRMWQRGAGDDEALPEDAKNYVPVFVAWWNDPSNRHGLPCAAEQYVQTLDEYEWMLWELGASLEQIEWYRRRQGEPGMEDEWRRKSEFPSTADEAFQTTGHRVFPKPYVLRARKTCKDPKYVGNLYADATTGTASLDNIRFVEAERGYLYVWALPGEHELADAKMIYGRRYCAFADIGGTTEHADYSTVKVFDRLPLLLGGPVEVVAVWHGHLDQDLFAWEAARLAKWYEDALLAVEVNSLRHDHGDEVRGFEGDHSYTILNSIRDCYRHLYARPSPQKDAERYDRNLGFHMNSQTKNMIMNTLKGALRDRLYIELDAAACDEMDYYEQKENGKLGAVEGMHDDRVISTAGGVWLAREAMDMVTETPITRPKERKKRTVADF